MNILGGLVIWFLLFAFVCGEINPMLWGTGTKIFFIFIGFMLISSNED